MRYKKSDISVAHIVEAATRVLARQGYAHTSLMDISSEAGMSKGAVHYHFPTKEALMTVVLKNACDTVAGRTREVWTEGEKPLPALRSSLLKLWRVRAELSDETAVVADLLAQSLHDRKLREPLAEYYRFAAAQVQEHLQANLLKVGLKPKLPLGSIARILHAFLDGFLMQHIVDPEATSEEALLDSFELLASSLFEFEGAESG